MIFRQLFDQETWTYTYLLADEITREAVLIDTVNTQAERDLNLLNDLNLELKFILDTHVHADHITGADILRKSTGAKTVGGEKFNIECMDLTVKDQEEIAFGQYKIKVLATPGHTDGCTSYLVDNKLFTGDVLFIRGTGRTDFQQGNSEKMYFSIKNKFYSLPNDTKVYPGHDYKGMMVSTIGEEKRLNPRIKSDTTLSEFKQTMANLKLPNPKYLHVAVPANLSCGKTE
ncbi:MBL fold metallo-hydrolase [Bacteriovoracaceae bacterium]|nr:MBL fold metallo-hydrolase [Bacteriovoracaceae bacterium]